MTAALTIAFVVACLVASIVVVYRHDRQAETTWAAAIVVAAIPALASIFVADNRMLDVLQIPVLGVILCYVLGCLRLEYLKWRWSRRLAAERRHTMQQFLRRHEDQP